MGRFSKSIVRRQPLRYVREAGCQILDAGIKDLVAMPRPLLAQIVRILDFDRVMMVVRVGAQHEQLVLRSRKARENLNLILIVHGKDHVGVGDHFGAQQSSPMVFERNPEFPGRSDGPRVRFFPGYRVEPSREDADLCRVRTRKRATHEGFAHWAAHNVAETNEKEGTGGP
jgi:hypothetical protein